MLFCSGEGEAVVGVVGQCRRRIRSEGLLFRLYPPRPEWPLRRSARLSLIVMDPFFEHACVLRRLTQENEGAPGPCSSAGGVTGVRLICS